jgi:hypothetical protein
MGGCIPNVLRGVNNLPCKRIISTLNRRLAYRLIYSQISYGGNVTSTETEKLDHINYLELKAIYLALQCFTKNLANQYILIRSDNTTAVSYINRMGSVRFPKLANLARKIWRFCEAKNNFLTASYIPTGANLQADRESRTLLPDTEWSLSDNMFRQIVSHFGRPEIDLFASQHNFKCKTYFSWLRDPRATGVDAFTADWGSWYFYAFPPFCLILRTL